MSTHLSVSVRLVCADLEHSLPFTNLPRIGIHSISFQNGVDDVNEQTLSSMLDTSGRDNVLYAMELLAMCLLKQEERSVNHGETETVQDLQFAVHRIIRFHNRTDSIHPEVVALVRFVANHLLPLVRDVQSAVFVRARSKQPLALLSCHKRKLWSWQTAQYAKKRLGYVLHDPARSSWTHLTDADRIRLQLMARTCGAQPLHAAVCSHVRHNICQLLTHSGEVPAPDNSDLACNGMKADLYKHLCAFLSADDSKFSIICLNNLPKCRVTQAGVDHLVPMHGHERYGCKHTRRRAFLQSMERTRIPVDVLENIFDMSWSVNEKTQPTAGTSILREEHDHRAGLPDHGAVQA